KIFWMNYKVLLSENFKKEFKRLYKKYPSLKKELSDLIDLLSANPNQGTALGNNVFKIRLSVKSKGKGKSGGARILSYVKIIDTKVILFTIYNKGKKDSISDAEIKILLANLR
ncbi:MAG: type II toxin-antitoxin system RelE/ParE family toxin, partial [Chitinophagales bacterium]